MAVNEIIANVLRHSTPSAADLQVNFIDHEGKVHCVIRDDGGPFVNFPKEWEKAGGVNEADLGAHLGLRLVRSLWPEAFYIPRSETFPYNSFILPLTSKGSWRLPPYFRPSKEKKFRDLVLPLAMREDKQ